MTIMTPLSSNNPETIAWERYTKTDRFANSMLWLEKPEHRIGSMWAAFDKGWQDCLSSQPSDLEAENAALREKLAREVEYRPSLEWAFLVEDKEREIAALRERVEELELQVELLTPSYTETTIIGSDNTSDNTSRSVGAGGSVYPFGGRETETR